MNILIVDDREDGRYLLEALLEGNGYAVESAGNGRDALEKLRAGGIDLIVSDILMPVMDGFQFCQAVKADAALGKIPFIFYTATYTSSQDEAFALQLGADLFLRKPCEPDELLTKIRNVIRKETLPENAAASASGEDVLRLYNERLVHKLEQKMLEAEASARDLEEEKRRFKRLVDELPIGVILLDRNGAFRYVNPRFTSLFGYTLEELPDLTAWRLKAYPDAGYRENVTRRWQEARASGSQPESWMVRIKCRDGAIRQVRIHPSFLENGDQVVTFVDVSDQVRMEANLRQAQKMEAIATLAGGIAHDFNNILAAIMGFAELAAHEIPAKSPAAIHLGGILPAAERAKQLVGKILAFSRQSEQERVPLALHLVVEEVLSFLRSALPATIEIRPEIDRDCVAFADSTQVHQVVMNLCTNAFHAMKDRGGVLRVALKRVTLSPDQAKLLPGLAPGEYAKLTVQDTGCGMTPEILAKIYNPYFTTKSEGEGTGLGLSISHGIIESHLGAIDVTSEPGAGTAFDVYLPQMESQPETFEEIDEEPIPCGRERVLFVDDDDGLTFLVREMLRLQGYQVETCTAGPAALELLRADPRAFDLVITDLFMPQMTGYELAAEILRLRSDMPLILCSGTATAQVAGKAEACGFREFISKPFSRRDLAIAVRRVLDHLR
ncbi:response regulator [Candidatus Ozemobacteraceae bacterium]|nr:response regulator [Candidatus Ozemobacteraceae bacterium]